MGNPEGKGVLSRMAGILRVSPRVNEKFPWSSPRESLRELTKAPGQVIIEVPLTNGRRAELKFVNFGRDVGNLVIQFKMKKQWLRPANEDELSAAQKKIINEKPFGSSILAHGSTIDRPDGTSVILNGITGKIDTIENKDVQSEPGKWRKGLIFVFGIKQPNEEMPLQPQDLQGFF